MSRFEEESRLLVSARTWLRDLGYDLVETRGPKGMNQGFEDYAGERLGIRISADRDQWFVEIRPEGPAVDAFAVTRWFSLEDWSTCLGAPATFHDTRPTLTDQDRLDVLANSWWLQPQLDYLHDHLSEIEQACASDRIQATIRCLTTR